MPVRQREIAGRHFAQKRSVTTLFQILRQPLIAPRLLAQVSYNRFHTRGNSLERIWFR